MKRIIVLVLAAALLQSCAMPYARFYHDTTGGLDVTKLKTVIMPTGEPKVFRGSSPKADALKMMEDGYALLGYSSFNGGTIDQNGAIAQAKKVHAAVVILYAKYTNTTSGAIPLTLPETRTSSTTMTGSVYGSGGYANYTGNAYTTTYGSRTTYIPYSTRHYDYFASYWIKLKSPIFGTYLRDVPQDARRKDGSNKGMLIYAIVRGSPAFEANIIEGDVLRAIGSDEINDKAEFHKALIDYQGRKVAVRLYRDGKKIMKMVQLGTRK